MGAETPEENITGYTLRKLGYAASEAHDMNLTQLKSFIDQDKPLILLMWYSSYHGSTHYRVATGYNEILSDEEYKSFEEVTWDPDTIHGQRQVVKLVYEKTHKPRYIQ